MKNIEKTGVTDYWIIFSEVTERGDNVGYFIIGTLCFISGLAMGVFLTALIVLEQMIILEKLMSWGMMRMSYKNSEGYSDPTAGVAMGSAKKQEQEIDKLNHKVMQSFRLLLDLAGFEIVGRVTLRHKKSGRIFK